MNLQSYLKFGVQHQDSANVRVPCDVPCVLAKPNFDINIIYRTINLADRSLLDFAFFLV